MENIRYLRETDLADCMRLKEAAGWNQTLADWQALLRCAPLGCFGVESDEKVVATATAVVHNDMGWVGMVLTDPLYRGRGFATALMKGCLDYLDSCVETVKLDASAEGESLYRKLGFVEEAVIERWACPAPLDSADHRLRAIPNLGIPNRNIPSRDRQGAVPPPEALRVQQAALLPTPYTGPLRHADIPLDAVAECAGAWAAGRAGSAEWYFGPCYGLDSAPVELVARALLAGRGRAYWDLFPSHAAAAVAGRLGFAPARRLLRMVRGTPAPTTPDVYAISGFEWG